VVRVVEISERHHPGRQRRVDDKVCECVFALNAKGDAPADSEEVWIHPTEVRAEA